VGIEDSRQGEKSNHVEPVAIPGDAAVQGTERLSLRHDLKSAPSAKWSFRMNWPSTPKWTCAWVRKVAIDDDLTIKAKNEQSMNTIIETQPTNRVSRTEEGDSSKSELLRRYLKGRDFSKKICETLEPEDCVIQTMPEASPTKWHLAHTSWFFETFVLKQFFPDYESLHPQYAFLFNSYYNAVGPEWRLVKAQNFLAEAFASWRVGEGFKDDASGKRLHAAQDFL
jgi:hypothetical protein